MKPWLIGGIVLLIAAPLQAQELAPPAREVKTTFQVPYKLTDSKHVMVRVKLNGKGPFNFILDTGAPALIMSEVIAKKTGVELKKGWGEFKLDLEGGLSLPDAKGLATDMFQLKGMNAMGLAGVELHGVLGYNILARYKIEYDFTQDKLAFTKLKYEPPKMIGMGRDAKGGQGGGLEAMGDLMKVLAPLMGMSPNFNLKPRGFVGIEVEERDGKLFVKSVLEGGPAEKAGLKAGDQITSANKKSIDDTRDLFKAIQTAGGGDKVPFAVKRGDATEKMTVELGKGL